MKKNNKGITVISLIVVIVSIIILSAIAITAGYRYITESQTAEKTALVNIISEAAYRRQNDLHVGGTSYYSGLLLKKENINNDNFKSLPSGFTSTPVELNGLEPIWFMLDGESAEGLGTSEVKKYSKYIVGSLDEVSNNDNYSPVAIVEYITGTTYLVEGKNSFINLLVASSTPADHEHKWTVATCTEPGTCLICKAENPELPALGHNIIPATCTQAEMCTRCGTVFAPATGHDFEYEPGENPYTYDALKHWKECKNGCGTRIETGNHIKSCVSVNDSVHVESCSVCGWESAETSHKLEIENVDANHHKIYCTVCEYERTHSDSGWWNQDRDKHWKICEENINTCGDDQHRIFIENHKDENNDRICDVCGRRIDNTPPKAFDDGDIVIKSRTTHQIEVEAKTEDDDGGIGIDRYEFSIDGGATWNTVSVANDAEKATWKFNNLVHNKTHTVIIKVYDKSNNCTEGRINVTTYEVPAEQVVSVVSPEAITKTNVTVTLSMPTLDLPTEVKNELKIVYRIDGNSSEWTDYTTPITVTSEATTVIYTKIVDKREPTSNSSSVVKTINVSNIDKTPPTITIDAPNITNAQTSRTATIRVRDEKAGMAQDTNIYYQWTTSETAPSTASYTQYVRVAANGKEAVFTVNTPDDAKGRYYLWIKQGVEDAVGNATTDPVKSTMYFDVDNIAPQLTVRTMRNKEDDVIDELFVRKGKNITIDITADKELSKGPLVQIITSTSSKEARATSSDGIHWVATIMADDTFTEDYLNNVKFTDYTSVSGKAGAEYTTTSDGKYMTYDRTLPALNYVNKGGVTGEPLPTDIERARMVTSNVSVMSNSQLNGVNDSYLLDRSKVRMVLSGKVPVPIGYYYVEGTKDDGLVIADSEQGGNEYVWVPVYRSGDTQNSEYAHLDDMYATIVEGVELTPGSNKTYIYGQSVLGDEMVAPDKKGVREPVLETYHDNEDNASTYLKMAGVGAVGSKTATQMFANELIYNFNEIIESIRKYGGFYVGRYELGYFETEYDTPVCKMGATEIASNVAVSSTDSTSNMWYGLYAKCKLMTKNEIVNTNMMWETTWDAIFVLLTIHS